MQKPIEVQVGPLWAEPSEFVDLEVTEGIRTGHVRVYEVKNGQGIFGVTQFVALDGGKHEHN